MVVKTNFESTLRFCRLVTEKSTYFQKRRSNTKFICAIMSDLRFFYFRLTISRLWRAKQMACFWTGEGSRRKRKSFGDESYSTGKLSIRRVRKTILWNNFAIQKYSDGRNWGTWTSNCDENVSWQLQNKVSKLLVSYISDWEETLTKMSSRLRSCFESFKLKWAYVIGRFST